MTPTVVRSVLMIALAAVCAQSQPPQDLQAVTTASGLLHTGSTSIAADAAGTVWVANAFAVPATTVYGVTSSGAVIPTALSARCVFSDLAGVVHLIAPAPGGGTSVYRLDAAGAPTLAFTLPAIDAFSAATTAPGTFFFATATDVVVHFPNLGVTNPHLTGTTGTLASGPNDELYVSTGNTVLEVVAPQSTVLRWQSPGVPDATSVAYGWYDRPVVVEAWYDSVSDWARVVHAPEPGARAGAFTSPAYGGIVNGYDETVPAITRDPGAGHHVLAGGTLTRITGTPALLSFWTPAPGQAALRVDAPAASPVVVGVDVPGLAYAYPGFGVAHTSLGLLPTFLAYVDGVGAFGPPDPQAITPYATTASVPVPIAGVVLALEAYVPHPAAANGWILISNVEIAIL